MRIFIGIGFSDEYKNILKKIKEHWKTKLFSKIKWTEEKNFHLTLRFLGEVEDHRVDQVKDALCNIKMNSFIFEAGSGGFFPNIKRPRIIWVGSKKGEKECINLEQNISNNLDILGFKKQDKPFKVHLTLGRIKYFDHKDRWPLLQRYLNDITWPELTISHFTLWQSTLTRQGPIYTPLATYNLL